MKLVGASLFTLGLILSFVFFVIVLAMISTDNMNIWFAMTLTVVFNFIAWLVGPWITDWINRFFYKVQFLTPEEVKRDYPQIAKLIEQISTEHNFKFPKVGIIPDNNPTAYTYGSGRYNARLVLTKGIFKYLNPDEQRAVVGHEMGHIVHRDFIVMMLASTLVQLLYELYASLVRSKGDRKNNAAIIGLVAYVLYIIASYLLLFLSRTRETLADRFAATVAEPEDLSNALIKIAYGIVTEEDSGSAQRLLNSTRHMGLVDVKDAKHAGGVSYITGQSKSAITEAMLFDTYSPWAKVIELNSTHPLTGRRVSDLSRLPSRSGRHFSYDVEGTAARTMLDHRRLWGVFWRDMGALMAPVALGVLISLITHNIGFGLAAFGIGLIGLTLYRFPSVEPQPTTVLDEMRNPYASPLRGKPVSLQGSVVGRGVAGYVFGEDLMYQDRTGLTFVDYHSAFSFLGNLFFGLKKVKQLIGQASTATGWFYRSIASSLTLVRLEVKGQPKPINSYRRAWSLAGAVFVSAIGVVVGLVIRSLPA